MKRIHAVDQNLLTQWHARYRGPGVLVYWHVERRSVCIYSQLKSCTSSEVAAMLEGVLRHGADMQIKQQMTERHVIFDQVNELIARIRLGSSG